MTIIPPWFQFISQVSGISVCQHIRLLNNILSHLHFSMLTYHGIDQNLQSPFIWARQHIKASVSNSYRRLFRHASISRHSIIPSVIANFGSVIYKDVDLKANKYHISYHIRSHKVSRFGILTYLIILHTNKCPVLAQPKRHISIPALSKQTMSMRHGPRGKVSINSPRGKVAQEAK
jgi:hypothetical protein